MIEKLTQEQLDYIPVHNKKYIDAWSEYIELTQEEANKTAEAVYELIGKPLPDNIIIAHSPFDANEKLWGNAGGLSVADVWGAVGDVVRAVMWNTVQTNVKYPMWCFVRKVAWSRVKIYVWNFVTNSVRDIIDRKMLLQSLPASFIYPYIDGFDAGYFAWIDYYIYLGIEFDEDLLKKYELYRTACKHGLVYPLDDFCIVCSRPKDVHLK